MKKLFLLILISIVFPSILFAGQLYPEKYYQEIFCNEKDGNIEVVMKDQTRCDCIFEQDGVEYAIEVDFAKKKYQAVGQALHYSRMTGKHGGIVLIIEEDKDNKYLNAMIKDIKYHKLDIRVFTISPPEYNEFSCKEYGFSE